jgi:hypothetical protein
MEGPKMKRGMRERLAHIETEARVMAQSGKYRSFVTIEMVLLTQGFREARRLFANRWTQAEVDRLCELANRRAVDLVRTEAA